MVFHLEFKPKHKASIYLILIILCFVNMSCIKKINLYQGDKDDNENTEKSQDIISETDFLYPFHQEAENIQAEIMIHTNSPLPNIETLKAEFPVLKYNKSWLLMLTQDDCKHAAFSCTWAAINGKPLSPQYFYDLAHLQAGDLPPDIYYLGKTLGSTDGAGNEIRFSFTTTLLSEWDSMNVKTNIHKGFTENYYRFFMKSSLIWGNVREMLNYGVGIAFHDVMANDVNNENDILKHYEIAQNIILEKLSGRGCKMLAEPNGNKTYVNAALSYSPIQTMTAQTQGIKLYPYQDSQNLNKALIERSFYNPPLNDKRNNIDMIKAAITDELLKPKEQRSAIYIGVHGTDTGWGELLLWINNEYGKDGLDNVWMPNQEEYYEYNYYRTLSVINSPSKIDDHTLKFSVSLPSGQYFYYPSVTINLSGIQLENIASIETNNDVTGLSYADYKDGIMLNIDCRKYLFEHAENFVKRYEANPSDASNKADALYFVNILKESAKKEALKKRLQ